MLFEGARCAIAQARRHMQSGATAAKGAAISKAIAIVDQGLKASLNRDAGGDIANQLFELYEYMCRRLVFANLRNDLTMLDEVARLVGELHESWEAIGQRPLAAASATPHALGEKRP
jgi:flagellar protein FliS